MGEKARRIVEAAAPFTRNPVEIPTGPNLVDQAPIACGPFRITPYLVDHSAYDAYALLIEAEGKRLFYSGDLRIHGRKHQRVENLIATPPAAIDVLLLEGTTVGRNRSMPPISEHDVEQQLAEICRATHGLVIVNASPQNIDRMVSIFKACRQAGRELVVDLYAAEVLRATGNLSVPQTHWDGMALCVPRSQRIQIKQNRWFDCLKSHSRNRIFRQSITEHPERYLLLFRRGWMRELENTLALAGASYVHSQWEGYLRSESFADIGAWCAKHRLPVSVVHCSGHASPDDLRRFASALAPRVVVPIHSERPDRFGELHSRVEIHHDGEWWAI